MAHVGIANTVFPYNKDTLMSRKSERVTKKLVNKIHKNTRK